MKIMVINGPCTDTAKNPEPPENLNGLIARKAKSLGIDCEIFQSDSEGGLVTLIQSAWGGNGADGVILNAGKFATYSIAIRDAVASIDKPVIEVRAESVGENGETHGVSVVSAVCRGVISGFGRYGYILALHAFAPDVA